MAAARGQSPTPEQQAAQRAAADRLKQWRTSVSMDRFKALRKMYNDAGVTIYAWKALDPTMSDAEFEYVFNVAEALGCTHTTLELPTDVAQLKRIGAFAEKRKIYAAYHTHIQATMTSFDQAFALSKANMANVDLGHYVAGTGESPIPFLRKFHDRIASVHLKDRRRRHTAQEPAVGNRRHAADGDPSADEAGAVHVSGLHRARIRRAGRIGRGQGSHGVPGLL